MAKKLDLPKLEEEIQGYWEKNGVYRSVIESRRTGKKFYFLQGPPFTSGKAHLGHAC
jgi:isoleucyl-tRNA synthetase